MKTINKYVLQTLFVILMFSSLVAVFYNNKYIFKTQAADNGLVIKIKLQGKRKIGSISSAKVTIYNNQGKALEINNLKFTAQDTQISQGDIKLPPDFNLSQMYALYIKPEKYLGKIFCSSQTAGDQCNSPQFIFNQGQNNIDLTKEFILAGDISPQDGKVDSYDLSKIVADLGKISTVPTDTDINNDLTTNVVDFSLVFWALSQNAVDDQVKIITALPTNTPTPTVTLQSTISPIPSSMPITTFTPTPQPTAAPTAPVNLAGQCHTIKPAMVGGGDIYQPNGSSDCVCESHMGYSVCVQSKCSNCLSGTCECEPIPLAMPPWTLNCSGGATYTAENCTQ